MFLRDFISTYLFILPNFLKHKSLKGFGSCLAEGDTLSLEPSFLKTNKNKTTAYAEDVSYKTEQQVEYRILKATTSILYVQ